MAAVAQPFAAVEGKRVDAAKATEVVVEEVGLPQWRHPGCGLWGRGRYQPRQGG